MAKKAKENQEPKKKRDWKKTAIIVVAVIAVLYVIGVFMPSEEKEEKAESETQIAEAETEAAVIEEMSDEYQWEPGELAYLDMSREQLLEIYKDYDNALSDESGWDLQGDEYRAWEDDINAQIAEKYDISTEDLHNIFIYGTEPNYFATFDVDNVKLYTGDLVYALVNGGVVVVEADVSGGWNNKDQIQKNYRNAANFIRDYMEDGDYDKLEYWAIGDMTDGSKNKYISFTVPSYLFKGIIDQTIADTDLGDYVTDLYLLPSMRE